MVPQPLESGLEQHTGLAENLRVRTETALSSKTPANPTIPARPIVLVVDDDEAVREALSRLFRSVDLDTELYGSTAGLLERKPTPVESCIVLDVRLPGISGLDFQEQLARHHHDIPIIFMTGHGDIPMTVRAMKAGAVDFLTKPFRDQDMLDAVTAALALNRVRRGEVAETSEVQARASTLTQREFEIMEHVTAGLMNKQIAAKVGLSEITVKVHRGKVMKKMAAASLADLVRMADILRSGSAR
jgi:FixJ family two-component response regulator